MQKYSTNSSHPFMHVLLQCAISHPPIRRQNLFFDLFEMLSAFKGSLWHGWINKLDVLFLKELSRRLAASSPDHLAPKSHVRKPELATRGGFLEENQGGWGNNPKEQLDMWARSLDTLYSTCQCTSQENIYLKIHEALKNRSFFTSF